MNVIVGTAGHIDHGKTALIKALTGIDTDRLPQEKQRGITIDLGFADLTLGYTHFGFVDVPGHERFVKNMLVGASGIDLVLLVVASDEGVKPQTREHFDICRLLGIDRGIIVLTKSDITDAETQDLARLSVAEMISGTPFENAPILTVSTKTGYGVDHLKEVLQTVSASIPPRTGNLIARLPVDRGFSVRGFGAVVTGTLATGRIDVGTEMELLPNGHKVRVRGIQVHGKSVKHASSPQRVAVNLGGIDHSKVERGMVLADAGVLRPTQIIDAEIKVLPTAAKALRTRQRIRIHLGTTEALARIQVLNETGKIEPGCRDFVQIRLESPVIAVHGERFIVRSYSPQITIAGGSVFDSQAAKHRRKDLTAVREHLSEMGSAVKSSEYVQRLVSQAGRNGLRISDLQARTALLKEILTSAINENIFAQKLVDCGGTYVAADDFYDLCSRAKFEIEEFHKSEPLSKGIQREALRDCIAGFLPNDVFHAIVNSLESSGSVIVDKDIVRTSAYQTILSPSETLLREKLCSIYTDAGLEVPKFEEALADAANIAKLDTRTARKIFSQFLDSGEIVKVTDDFYFAKSAIDPLVEMMQQMAATGDRTIDVAQFKDLAGVSRKYAIPLLEYFDRTHVTARSGDKRIIL